MDWPFVLHILWEIIFMNLGMRSSIPLSLCTIQTPQRYQTQALPNLISFIVSFYCYQRKHFGFRLCVSVIIIIHFVELNHSKLNIKVPCNPHPQILKLVVKCKTGRKNQSTGFSGFSPQSSLSWRMSCGINMFSHLS